NLLDTRGAVGVTERQRLLGRTRDLAKLVASKYLKQRETLGYPWVEPIPDPKAEPQSHTLDHPVNGVGSAESDLLLEVGVEELPTRNVSECKDQLERIMPEVLKESRLTHGDLEVFATPRRIAVLVRAVASQQTAIDELVRGPA